MAEFAQHATVTQLQRTVARYDFTLESATFDAEGDLQPAERDPDAPPTPVEPPSLTMGLDADGRFRLRYDAPAEVRALVEAALREAKDNLFHSIAANGPARQRCDRCGGGTAGVREAGVVDRSRPACPGHTGCDALPGAVADPSGPAGRARVTWADALTLMATRSLEGAATVGRRARYRVNVFLDTDRGWLTGTPRLPRHLVDGLTCDGDLTPVWTTEGRPVNVGRAHRVVPHRTRVLVLDRDRGCRFPGCGTSAFVEVHHLLHWRDGGPTDLANLLSLCPHHHDGHHRGEFSVTGDPSRPDGLSFQTRTGLLIGPPQQARAASATGDHPTIGGSATRGSTPARGRVFVAGGVPHSDRSSTGPRPRPRLGRRYPAPTGGRLNARLVHVSPRSHQPLRT